MRKFVLIVSVAAAFWVAGLLQPVGAITLASAACDQLDKEKTALEAAGVQVDMRTTPDAAKALSPDRLQRIQRYVEVSGSVLFRCSTRVAATVVAVPAADTKIARTQAAKAATISKPASVKPRTIRTKKTRP